MFLSCRHEILRGCISSLAPRPAGMFHSQMKHGCPRGHKMKAMNIKYPISSVAELLAIILRTGTRGDNALELANKLLVKYGGLPGLVRADQPFAEQRGRAERGREGFDVEVPDPSGGAVEDAIDGNECGELA